MARQDIYHHTVRHALEKDGWQITHDPFRLRWGGKTLYADLGAERLLAAEKDKCKIVVEIKSFIGPSAIRDLQQALGQYIMYQDILYVQHTDRLLYLAVSEIAYRSVLSSKIGQLCLQQQQIHVLVFDEETEVITRWIPK